MGRTHPSFTPVRWRVTLCWSCVIIATSSENVSSMFDGNLQLTCVNYLEFNLHLTCITDSGESSVVRIAAASGLGRIAVQGDSAVR